MMLDRARAKIVGAIGLFHAGFRREGTLRRAVAEAGSLHDQAVFSPLDDEI